MKSRMPERARADPWGSNPLEPPGPELLLHIWSPLQVPSLELESKLAASVEPGYNSPSRIRDSDLASDGTSQTGEAAAGFAQRPAIPPRPRRVTSRSPLEITAEYRAIVRWTFLDRGGSGEMSGEYQVSRGRIGLVVPEDEYKVDLELLDRYQAYSAELLRLSLLGIAGYGFLIKEVLLTDKAGKLPFQARLIESGWLLIIGVVMLGASAATALAHRNLSTDACACIIAFLRMTNSKRPASPVLINRERKTIHSELKWSGRFLEASAWFLALGALCVVATFVSVLWHWHRVVTSPS